MKKQIILLLFAVILGFGLSSCSIVFSKTEDYTTNQNRQKKTRPANRPNNKAHIAESPERVFKKKEEEIKPSVTLSRAELELRSSITNKAKSLKNIPYLYGGKNKRRFRLLRAYQIRFRPA